MLETREWFGLYGTVGFSFWTRQMSAVRHGRGAEIAGPDPLSEPVMPVFRCKLQPNRRHPSRVARRFFAGITPRDSLPQLPRRTEDIHGREANSEAQPQPYCRAGGTHRQKHFSFPGPHREPPGSRTGPAGPRGIQAQRALRSRAPGLGLPQEAQVQLSSLREDSREVSGLVAGPFTRETARFAKLPSGARLFGCQQTSEIFCASFRKPNCTFILKAPSSPQRCARLPRAMAFQPPKRKSTDVTATPISWAFSTPSNGSPGSCGSLPTTL